MDDKGLNEKSDLHPQDGHRFVRYADDCSVYVRSHKAGERVLRGPRKFYNRLHLKVNEGKTAVTGAFGRRFLYPKFLNLADNARRSSSRICFPHALY